MSIETGSIVTIIGLWGMDEDDHGLDPETLDRLRSVESSDVECRVTAPACEGFWDIVTATGETFGAISEEHLYEEKY